ncbi:nucleotide-diphospho-sugar transferase [Mrakia frigida]|uniref:glycosyltransferase family 15 protein n=1 Tax=Mrakia frigida TaxID=29902 RepID=UPI003FCC1D76
MPFQIPSIRPRTAIALVLSLLSLVLLLHPQSPISIPASSFSSSKPYVSPYSSYPPNIPERQAAGWNGTGIGRENRRRANATFVMLARNSDLYEILPAMQNMEDRFNWWAGYDWVFLNDQPFSEEFIRLTSDQASTKTQFGLIDPSEWNQPDWIDEDKATKAREQMIKENVIYGGSVPYRNMCRYNSGFFFRHPLLLQYRFYWRMEQSVKFFCDLHYDPFLVMEDEKKVYGFTLSLFEYTETIVTLWDTVKEFMTLHPEHVAKDNSMDFLSDDGGAEYNHCHFWSNFEIGDLDFWRGEAYMAFFNFLESKGGFYYERWGDAPVHSLGVGLFAPKDSIKFFSDIGYYHGPYSHCPVGDAHRVGRCSCKEEDNFDSHWFSCTNKWKKIHPGKNWFGSP